MCYSVSVVVCRVGFGLEEPWAEVGGINMVGSDLGEAGAGFGKVGIVLMWLFADGAGVGGSEVGGFEHRACAE